MLIFIAIIINRKYVNWNLNNARFILINWYKYDGHLLFLLYLNQLDNLKSLF